MERLRQEFSITKRSQPLVDLVNNMYAQCVQFIADHMAQMLSQDFHANNQVYWNIPFYSFPFF